MYALRIMTVLALAMLATDVNPRADRRRRDIHREPS